jgi:dTDP-4-amino-4,6-dideoxygalactose transaminase
MIPVTKPYIPDIKKLFTYIEKANEKEWLTNFGPLHNELTSRLEDWLGVKNLLLVSNGTLALQIAFKALGLKNRILTTPFSFVATTSALVWEGLEPEFIDIDSSTLGMNPKLLPKKLSNKTTGALAVHVYGNPADTNALDSYCKSNNLKMIYDGAHAFGIKRGLNSILNAGDATTLSLHATKVFHTVEGGAIVFKNRTNFEIAKQIINFGYDDKKEIVRVGINSKLNEYQAAVGLTLLDEIESIIERRVSILNRYINELKSLVEFPAWDLEANQNGAYAPIILNSEAQLLYLQKELEICGVQTRRYFHPSLNEVSHFSKEKTGCVVSEDISRRVLCLPIYTIMTRDEQDFVIKNIKNILGNKL